MSERSPTEEETPKDPGQFVPPRVDTAPEIVGSLTWSDLKAGIPSALAFVAGGAGIVTGSAPLLWSGVAGGVTLGVAGVGLRLTDRWYTSPRERLSAWRAHLQRSREGDTGGISSVDGVAGVTEHGFIKMDDGRYVAPVPIQPRNTAKLDQGERNRIAATLSTAIDEQVRDMPFRLYSTTRETDVDDVAGRYEARAFDDGTDDLQADVLLDVADWLREADAPTWDAREWRHYIVVEADAAAVVDGGNPSMIDMLNPLAETATDEVTEAQIRETLADRVDDVRGAIDSVPGLDTREPTPAESLEVARGFWGRDGDLPEELVADAVAGDADVSRLCSPESWTPRRGWVSVGNQYAKTLWVAEYPNETASLWLKRLCTLRGVAVDVTVNVDPERLDAAIHEVSKDVADVGSEGAERAENQEVSAMDTDTAHAAKTKLRELLKETPSQAWQLSAYVTVRVDDEDALDEAAETMAEFDDVDGARRAALEGTVDTVEDVLTRTPANTTPVTPDAAQEMAYRSASPLTGDVWNAETAVEKTRRVPGAAIGSMFPFAAVDLREDDGMDWGRNEENGSLLRLSPFARGGAPHMLTIGQTRSGKTYSASKAALRWYLEREDRTLIVCDTQKGFDGLTQLAGGEHIVVDGEQGVNPLRIDPEESHRSDGADEFRLTVEETVGFLVGLLESDDVASAGEYAPLLAQAAERTLVDHGITPEDPRGCDDEQPTLRDLMDTLVHMNDNPGEYTWSEAGHEVESHKEQVGDLLTKLRSFQESGKFANMVGADELGLLSEDIDMAYLDLHDLPTSGDAGKSAMLQLMLSQVRQKIKQTEGEVVVMFDEAHVLLNSPRTLDWLQKATREFARYDACLWFLSQSPEDFVGDDGKNVIRQQMGATHFFRTPETEARHLQPFGLNTSQMDFVREKAVRGKDDRGYSECLISFADVEGWIPTYVESSPLEDRVLTYERRDHGGQGSRREDFQRYMAGEEIGDDPATETDGQPRDERGRFA
jgi:hypothetical protein